MIRSRFGIALLAALGVAAATVAGSALHSASHPHVATRDQASFLFSDFPREFDPRPGDGTQIDTITLTNQNQPGTTPVLVKSLIPKVDGPTGFAGQPWTVGPNEDCRNASIAPGGYCAFELSFTPPNPEQQDLFGEVDVTLGDNSTVAVDVGVTTDNTFGMPPTNPLQINYGNVTVGTTTGARTVTVGADPTANQRVMSVLPVAVPTQTNAAGDYHKSTDTCTNTTLNQPNQTCTIGVTTTPGAAGNRPAFLDIAYCDPDDFPNISTSPGTPDREPPPAVPPGQELICGPGNDGPDFFAQHILVALTANGLPPTSGTPPPNQTFTPTLTDSPAVAPAGRTTFVGGAGFPANTAVILAFVPLGTPATTNLATVPGSVTVMSDATGMLPSQLMLIMPHTTPGQYEFMGAAATANATVPFLVAPGTQEPPKFVTRH